jgi:hypothetical protein
LNATDRLAEIVAAFERVKLDYLVMGGHAARYYGIQRTTIDFDIHVSVTVWKNLTQLLTETTLIPDPLSAEGPSWRRDAFRRFLIGRLSDGREEWLQFWGSNHLLPPFDELHRRQEAGEYGGRLVCFLSLPDLIRSKETERESDWQDVALLEEFCDARHLAAPPRADDWALALRNLRSRRGFERAQAMGLFQNAMAVAQAIQTAVNPMSQAFLRPFVTGAPGPRLVAGAGMIEEILNGPLTRVDPGSVRHLALVEAVRRLYKQHAKEVDKADKQRSLSIR